MFVDDCLIFCRATKRVARLVKDILHYSKVSGQLINHHKSKVQFSASVRTSIRKELAEILNIPHSTHTYDARTQIIIGINWTLME